MRRSIVTSSGQSAKRRGAEWSFDRRVLPAAENECESVLLVAEPIGGDRQRRKISKPGANNRRRASPWSLTNREQRPAVARVAGHTSGCATIRGADHATAGGADIPHLHTPGRDGTVDIGKTTFAS